MNIEFATSSEGKALCRFMAYWVGVEAKDLADKIDKAIAETYRTTRREIGGTVYDGDADLEELGKKTARVAALFEAKVHLAFAENSADYAFVSFAEGDPETAEKAIEHALWKIAQAAALLDPEN
ncbi:hypothetical protein FACS1894217_08890 [Clostridia bacterium]|nr:hypothetical protein FACS1894202_09210 [Clostridia bacterium]GHV07669.1 hypothetical protein FACS1894217_08890 [Clostridia bacterium]